MKQDILERLENLYHFLNEEGWYTKANTAYLAIEEIKKLREELAEWIILYE